MSHQSFITPLQRRNNFNRSITTAVAVDYVVRPVKATSGATTKYILHKSLSSIPCFSAPPGQRRRVVLPATKQTNLAVKLTDGDACDSGAMQMPLLAFQKMVMYTAIQRPHFSVVGDPIALAVPANSCSNDSGKNISGNLQRFFTGSRETSFR